jgi:hypothetical protein
LRGLLPEVLKLEIYALYQISTGNPQKDNFHKLIYGIDKVVTFGIVNLTFLISFLFPKGVVDGERPLKFSLSKF